MRSTAATLVWVALAVGGCKAQARSSSGGPDAAAPDLAAVVRADAADLGPADLAPSCPVGPEICNNECDDDRNGYIDGDDPACTAQMLVTLQTGGTPLYRLILATPPRLATLDATPVQASGLATYKRAFSPAAFIVYDGATNQLEKRDLMGGVVSTNLGYSAHDVCVFGNQLIVVDAVRSQLHRYQADGKTELMPPITAVPATLTACASDGNLLYVARHANNTTASEFWVLDQTMKVVASGIPMPAALTAQGYDRCVDLAWTKKDGVLIGLFAKSNSLADSMLNGQLMAPFSLDGGLGPAIDAGVYHGAGEFLP
jgi:hypothetical protein